MNVDAASDSLQNSDMQASLSERKNNGNADKKISNNQDDEDDSADDLKDNEDQSMAASRENNLSQIQNDSDDYSIDDYDDEDDEDPSATKTPLSDLTNERCSTAQTSASIPQIGSLATIAANQKKSVEVISGPDDDDFAYDNISVSSQATGQTKDNGGRSDTEHKEKEHWKNEPATDVVFPECAAPVENITGIQTDDERYNDDENGIAGDYCACSSEDGEVDDEHSATLLSLKTKNTNSGSSVSSQTTGQTEDNGGRSGTEHKEKEHWKNEPATDVAVPECAVPVENITGIQTDDERYNGDENGIAGDYYVCSSEDGEVDDEHSATLLSLKTKNTNSGSSVSSQTTGQTEDNEGHSGTERKKKEHWKNEPATNITVPECAAPVENITGIQTDDERYNDDENGIAGDYCAYSSEDGEVDDEHSATLLSLKTKNKNSGSSETQVTDDTEVDQERGQTAASSDDSLVKDLRRKLHAITTEKTRLREAVDEKLRMTTKGSGTDKELEMLRSQVSAARAVITSSLDSDEENQERSLLELVLLMESKGYKKSEEGSIRDNLIKTINNTLKKYFDSDKAYTLCAHTVLRTRGGSGHTLGSFPFRQSSRRSKRTAGTRPTTTEPMTGKYPAPAESAAKATAVALKVESTARSELEKRVESLERDLARVGEESGMQSEWAASTQGYLDAVEPSRDDGGGGRLPRNDDDQYGPEAVATSDIIALKLKAAHLVEKLRQEKYAWLKSEREAQKMGAKVQMLSDHIEKLMVFLKHEATQKAKAHEQQRRLKKELELVKARSSALMRSNQAKDRVMVELREGSKVLEDQLRLMDEKYMELRTKLDWTRTKGEKDVRKARAQASALRAKWAILCGDAGMSQPTLLDSMKVDAGPSLCQSESVPRMTTKSKKDGIPTKGNCRVTSGCKSRQEQQQQRQGPLHGVLSTERSRDLSPAGGRLRPDSALSGRMTDERTGAAREEAWCGGQGLTSSTSAPSLFSKHRNARGLQGHNACAGLSRAGTGAKERGQPDSQQRCRIMSRNPQVGGRSPKARVPESQGASSRKDGDVIYPDLSAGSNPDGRLLGDASVARRVWKGKITGEIEGRDAGEQCSPWGKQGGKEGDVLGRNASQLWYA